MWQKCSPYYWEEVVKNIALKQADKMIGNETGNSFGHLAAVKLLMLKTEGTSKANKA